MRREFTCGRESCLVVLVMVMVMSVHVLLQVALVYLLVLGR